MSWLGLQPLPEYLSPTETKYPPWRAERAAGEAAARVVRRAMVMVVVEIIFDGINGSESSRLKVWVDVG
jgi:hypothetical protein